jgi:D-glycero-alpha-D-manno-heptose-7-phosphate kinase
MLASSSVTQGFSEVVEKGSVRVDLLGGTLDLEPINLILPEAWTLNVATSLKAEVKVSFGVPHAVKIFSQDYQKEYFFSADDLQPEVILYSERHQEMRFVLQLLHLFRSSWEDKGLVVHLASGAPAGSGLGGSSAMGVTLAKAMLKLCGKKLSAKEIILRVKAVESRILNQGLAGYQDYFPALYGGVLAIKGIEGDIQVEQYFSQKLKADLQNHIALIYSGVSRQSGINNWEVYKGFFDKKPEIRQGMESIAKLAAQAYQALKLQDTKLLLRLMSQEGQVREELFPGICPPEIRALRSQVLPAQGGLKMCGAGGGGCFLLIYPEGVPAGLAEKINQLGMRRLDFEIVSPLD